MDNINIKKIIEERGLTGKFNGVAPEGFVLVHENALEELETFEVWKNWKSDEISIQELNNKHFDKL